MTASFQVGPDSVGWQYLTTRISVLDDHDTVSVHEPDRETLVVLVEGSIRVCGSGINELITRSHPWLEVSAVVYLPPGAGVTISSISRSEIAMGLAPASGRFDPHVIRYDEMSSELRGGGTSTRQVVTSLGPQHGAERLLSYEAWVPRGCWTGWPPHRHDGEEGSPYLEETYYYRFDRESGFGFHRNFDRAADYEETTAIRDRSLVAVPRGYHLCAAGPPANAWALNFLAGSPEDRARPPEFDPKETWIAEDWSAGLMNLPAVPDPADFGPSHSQEQHADHS